MKSLPRIAPLLLLALLLASVSCATPSNRRALYFSTKPHGPWTDYERRREAEAATGVVGGASTPAKPTGPATPQPKTGPVTPLGALTPTTAAPGDVATPAATPAPDAGAPAALPAPDAAAPAATPAQ